MGLFDWRVFFPLEPEGISDGNIFNLMIFKGVHIPMNPKYCS
jgi:hypothetical protein